MKVNRRIFILLSVTVLIASLSACKPSNSKDQSEQSKSNNYKSEDSNKETNITSSKKQSLDSTRIIGKNSKVQDNNKETGLVKLWEFSDISYDFKPINVDNSIFACAENALLKIDKETGEKIYEVSLGSNYTGGYCISDNIMVSNSSFGVLEAMDIRNGEILWDYGTHLEIYCNPAVKDDIVYSVSTFGVLDAIDIKTGQELWSFDPNSSFNSYNSPVIIGDTLYFLPGEDSDMYAIDLTTRKEKWRLSNLGLDSVFLTYVDNTIYAVSTDGIVCAIGAEKGQLLWKKRLSSDEDKGFFSFVAMDKECLTVFNSNNHIYRIDLENGDLALDYTYEGDGTIGGVAEIGNDLFFTTDNDIISIDKNGDNIKPYNLSTPLGGEIVSDGDEIYCTSSDGKLLKYKLVRSR